MTVRLLFFIFILLYTGICTASDAQEPLSVYQVVSVSQIDELAVIKNSKGQLGTFTVGDVVPELPYEIVKIAEDRVIFRDGAAPADVVILYLYQEGAGSRLQRISSKAPSNISSPTPREYDLTRSQ